MGETVDETKMNTITRKTANALILIIYIGGVRTFDQGNIPTSLGASVAGQLPNSAFKSSSQLNRLSYASKGRLHLRGSYAAWIPDPSDPSPWIQVDLGSLSDVFTVLTQGRQDGNTPQYTESYTVSYSSDGDKFVYVTENGVEKVFSANQNKDSVVRNDLVPPIQARFVKLHPQQRSPGSSSIALRFDLLGYPACKDGFQRFQTHCYKFVSTVGNFSEHQRDCMEAGGNLASVTSAEENEFLVRLSNGTRSWIGGKLDPNTDTHTWVDGSHWIYSSWRQREPNRWGGREFCVEINYVRSGLWNDHFCTRHKPAICKRA